MYVKFQLFEGHKIRQDGVDKEGVVLILEEEAKEFEALGIGTLIKEEILKEIQEEFKLPETPYISESTVLNKNRGKKK